LKDPNGQLIPKVGVVLGIRFSRLVTPEWAIGLATQNFGMGVNVAYAPVHCENPKTGSKGLTRDLAAEYIVQCAVDNDVPYVMLVDDDVELPFGACHHLMRTLASSEPDVMVAGGIYVTKQDHPEPIVFKDISFGAFWRWKKDTVFPCELLGLGCSLWKTEVFKHIEKPWFRDVDTGTQCNTDDAFFFAKMKLNGFKALADAYVLPTHWDYETGKGYRLPEDSYPMIGDANIKRALSIPDLRWPYPAELAWLAEQAKDRKCIIEIGSYLGRSTVAMAENTKGTVIAVDDWCGPRDVEIPEEQRKELYDAFCRNIEGLANVIAFKVNHADIGALPSERPDMVFIDGEHDYESAKRDILTWKARLAPGGLLCGHDRNWEGVDKAIRELLPNWKPEPGSLWSCKL
jgi:hypothetical protein